MRIAEPRDDSGRIRLKEAVGYLLAQSIGATAAVVLLLPRAVRPDVARWWAGWPQLRARTNASADASHFDAFLA